MIVWSTRGSVIRTLLADDCWLKFRLNFSASGRPYWQVEVLCSQVVHLSIHVSIRSSVTKFVLKTNEPILMQIGTSDPWAKV